jgi:hypothetical protein
VFIKPAAKNKQAAEEYKSDERKVHCFSHASSFFFLTRHKTKITMFLFLQSVFDVWNSKRKIAMKAFFSSELLPTGTTSFSSYSCLVTTPLHRPRRGPAPFHTSAVFEMCLNDSFLPSPAPLFAAEKYPSRRKGGTPAHTRLAGVDSIFHDGVWGSAAAIAKCY